MEKRTRTPYSLTETICVNCSVLGCNSKIHLVRSIFETVSVNKVLRTKGWVRARHQPNRGRPICFLHMHKYEKAFKFKPDTGDVVQEN